MELWNCWCRFGQVCGISKVRISISFDDQIIRTIEAPSHVMLSEHGHVPILFEAYNAAITVLDGYEAPLAVERQTICAHAHARWSRPPKRPSPKNGQALGGRPLHNLVEIT